MQPLSRQMDHPIGWNSIVRSRYKISFLNYANNPRSSAKELHDRGEQSRGSTWTIGTGRIVIVTWKRSAERRSTRPKNPWRPIHFYRPHAEEQVQSTLRAAHERGEKNKRETNHEKKEEKNEKGKRRKKRRKAGTWRNTGRGLGDVFSVRGVPAARRAAHLSRGYAERIL